MNINKNISKLPPEIIVHISKYLNIKDKLKLRLINKEFKMTFDYLIKLNKLTLISTERVFNRNWFYTNRLNNEIDLIKFDDINILNDLFKNEFILNIRLLFFYSRKVINLNKTINQLKYLNELYIGCRIERNSILLLSKLKVLRIKQYRQKFKIQLETPLLSFIRCDNLEYYQFNYPEKIIYLDTQLMYEIRSYQIEVFKNLEYFILYNIEVIEISILINKLNHLKELHFNDGWKDDNNLIEIKKIYQLRSKLNNLRIFISGIDYENLKELNEDHFMETYHLDLIFRNYSNTINILPFIERMNFIKLIKFLNLNPTISLDDIILKFPNIKRIKAYDLNNENIDCFFEYLSKCNNLNALDLRLSIDDQFYYLNKIPDLFKRIRRLYLDNLNINVSTNLDFIFKFEKLYHLKLGKLEDLNILMNLSDNLNISVGCQFVYKEHTFTINYLKNKYTYEDIEFNLNNLIENLDYEINHFSSDYDFILDDSSD